MCIRDSIRSSARPGDVKLDGFDIRDALLRDTLQMLIFYVRSISKYKPEHGWQTRRSVTKSLIFTFPRRRFDSHQLDYRFATSVFVALQFRLTVVNLTSQLWTSKLQYKLHLQWWQYGSRQLIDNLIPASRHADCLKCFHPAQKWKRAVLCITIDSAAKKMIRTVCAVSQKVQRTSILR